jgi:hypothetical protein
LSSHRSEADLGGGDVVSRAPLWAARAAEATFDGIRVEYRAGLRQTLDVLIAQETLTGANVALVEAQHDDYVDQATVLSALGRRPAWSIWSASSTKKTSVIITTNLAFRDAKMTTALLDWPAHPEAKRFAARTP